MVFGVGFMAGGFLALNDLPLFFSIVIPSLCVGVVGSIAGAILINKAEKYYQKKDSFLLEESFTNTESKTKQQDNVIIDVKSVSKDKENDEELSM